MLIFPDWGALAAGDPTPFRLRRDASRDGSGATVDQQPLNNSVRPIVYLAAAPTLTRNDSRPASVLRLEASPWPRKSFRGYPWFTKFRI